MPNIAITGNFNQPGTPTIFKERSEYQRQARMPITFTKGFCFCTISDLNLASAKYNIPIKENEVNTNNLNNAISFK